MKPITISKFHQQLFFQSINIMDFPLFRSQWAKPSVSSPYVPTAAAARTPKVVQIPVHFVGSDSERSISALKIQKVFRGFLVRKCVKKIMAIKKEVDEIETRVSLSEEVESIKKDGKERLKVNEMLMSLLFKLDSVRGVDSGVRDCRRAVIKKAIALQERVDAIASSGNDPKIDSEILADQTDQAELHQLLEIQDVVAGASVEGGNSEDQIQNSDVIDLESGSGQVAEDRNNGGEVEGFDNELLIEEKCSQDVMNSEESEANNCKKEENGDDSEMNVGKSNTVANWEKEEFGFDSEMKGDEETCVEKVMVEDVERDVGPDVDEEAICERTLALSECVEESMEASQMENGIEREEENDGEGKVGGDDNKRNRKLLEKMMEDNEKMMKMMTKLFERNEVQARMLNTLMHRVEQLEKAFVCDRIKRKKKRHSA